MIPEIDELGSSLVADTFYLSINRDQLNALIKMDSHLFAQGININPEEVFCYDPENYPDELVLPLDSESGKELLRRLLGMPQINFTDPF